MRIFNFSFVLLSKFRSYIIVSNLKTHTLTSCKSSILSHKSQKIHLSSIKPFRQGTFEHFFPKKNGKIYKETENEYAHFIMEKSEKYSNSVLKCPLKIDDNLKLKDQLNIIDAFAKGTIDKSDGATIENVKYSSLVKELCCLLPQASDEEVKKILHYLCMWPPTSNTHTPNFKALWNALDGECSRRIKHWDVSHKLLIADYWFCLRLNRITQYNQELIFDLFKNFESLSSQQVVQLMFYVNLQRQLPAHYLPAVEKKLELFIDSITIEELGIICLACFKTESKISNIGVIQSIVNHLVTNLETANTITIAAILKFLRKSLNSSLNDTYILVLHKCIPYLNNWDIPTNVHVALLASECNVYHPLLLADVAEKLTNEIDEARIKDCSKLSQCLTHFNHFDGTFYDAVIAEIKKSDRQKEVDRYPKEIVYLSLYYAYMGHFDYEVLSKIFQKEFFQRCTRFYPDVLHALTEIDYCIEIECKNYSGPKLELFHRNVLKKRRGNLSKSNHQNMQTRLLSNVYDSLTDILGSDKNVIIRHILPHVYSPDIIFRLQTNIKKSLSEIIRDIPSEVVLIPPKDEVWVCFVVCGSFSFAHRSKQMTGVTAMKLRQLQKLGYQVVFIPFYKLPLNSSARKTFIKDHVNSLR